MGIVGALRPAYHDTPRNTRCRQVPMDLISPLLLHEMPADTEGSENGMMITTNQGASPKRENVDEEVRRALRKKVESSPRSSCHICISLSDFSVAR